MKQGDRVGRLARLIELGVGLEHLVLDGVAKRGDLRSGTAEKLSTRELPRPPVPITPMRTVDVGLNGTSAMLFAAGCVRPSPAPSDARPAILNKSRRVELFIGLITSRVS